MSNKEFPLFNNNKGIKGDPDIKHPLQENQKAVGVYDNLSTLKEPHLDPTQDKADGDWGVQP